MYGIKIFFLFFFSFHREQDGRKRVRELQKQLLDIKKEKEMEIQQRNEMISHLKDQLQVTNLSI